ncbi:acetyltransferase [Bacillus sp. AGMB 02131]|uniref:Acetyltransferase n=1 Tax=Peribacillus faecalis TaxID=2772559 RepID=A0A927CWS6_9BACI|nr:acyltransferase family protein [Peribacillus faecalis]MBD3109006.1 acetyltransferase [Peribacillus faecalis]
MNKMKPTRYIRSLDGLRGLAVLAVIAYHLNFPWASGGLLGVTIFFVLSGYLITNLLVIEYENNNRINLKNFWIRRARRLLPAMFTVLVTVTAWSTLFARPFLERLRDDFIPALLYYSNWWYIFQDLSYFEAMSTPSLLTHFWSLAIEEQFYIIWPLLIAGAFLCHMSKKQMVKLTLLMALLSSLLMALFYSSTTDPSRVYYGTDTRAFSLLIGAALAFIWPSQKLSKTIPASLRRSMDIIGAVCLTAILVMMVVVNQYDGFLYRGGMLLASLLTAVLLAVLIHPASKLGVFMTFKPLTWVGERSYGIYLWHFPVILLTSPQISTSETSLVTIAVQIALTLILSAISYKYIENPIRKGAVGSFYAKIQSRGWSIKQTTYRQWFTVGCIALLVTVSCIGLSFKSIGALQPEISSAGSATISEQSSDMPDADIKENSNKETTPAEKDEQPADEKVADDKVKQPQKAPTDYNITIIGDSVMVNVEPFIKTHFPNTTVNASIGRQLHEGTDLIKSMNQNNKLGDIVIIALGSNGSFTSDQLSDALEAVGSNRQIFLINTRVPRNWENIVNKRLEEAADHNPSVHLIDWYSTSSGRNEYFANDGIHLTQTGARAYAAMIAAEVQK